MKVDRSFRSSGFPVLSAACVAALTGIAACHVYVDEPAKRAQPAPPAPPPPPSAAAASPTPPSPPPPPTKVIPLRMPGAPPVAPAANTVQPMPATCFDTAAVPVGDCASVKTSAACGTAPLQKCNAYKANLTPKVAAAAVTCMAGLSAAQVCDGTSISTCARTALAQACPAPAVAQLCAIAATPCKTTTADCTAVLSGLSDVGQQSVAQCVSQGCATGLSACIDALGTATVSASLKLH